MTVGGHISEVPQTPTEVARKEEEEGVGLQEKSALQHLDLGLQPPEGDTINNLLLKVPTLS